MPAVTERSLVRHAATEPDGGELVDGRSDPPLSAAGEQQARRLADRLRPEAPTAVAVTPLRRTAQTAAPPLAATGLTASPVPSPPVFADRVKLGLAAAAALAAKGGRVVAVTHGGVIAETCRRATGSRPRASLPHLRHASVTCIAWTERRLTLVTCNESAHLVGAVATAGDAP